MSPALIGGIASLGMAALTPKPGAAMMPNQSGASSNPVMQPVGTNAPNHSSAWVVSTGSSRLDAVQSGAGAGLDMRTIFLVAGVGLLAWWVVKR